MTHVCSMTDITCSMADHRPAMTSEPATNHKQMGMQMGMELEMGMGSSPPGGRSPEPCCGSPPLPNVIIIYILYYLLLKVQHLKLKCIIHLKCIIETCLRNYTSMLLDSTNSLQIELLLINMLHKGERQIGRYSIYCRQNYLIMRRHKFNKQKPILMELSYIMKILYRG